MRSITSRSIYSKISGRSFGPWKESLGSFCPERSRSPHDQLWNQRGARDQIQQHKQRTSAESSIASGGKPGRCKMTSDKGHTQSGERNPRWERGRGRGRRKRERSTGQSSSH